MAFGFLIRDCIVRAGFVKGLSGGGRWRGGANDSDGLPMGASLCALWPLSGKYLRLGYGYSGVPQVQNGSMFVEPQVRELLLWLFHIRD